MKKQLNHVRQRTVPCLFALAVSLTLAFAVPALAEESVSVTGITVDCSMSSFGKEAKSIIYSVDDATSLFSLTAEDFALSGGLRDGSGKRTVNVPVTGFSFTSDSVILETESFLIDKSTELSMDCTNDALDFSYEDITAVTCPEHDAFTDETMTVGETTLRYKLYTPESFKDDELVPVVIYNHGGGCTGYDGVLTDDCFACAWALEENQNSIKCYVMAPYRGSLKEGDDPDEEREAIKAAIDALITDGHADPDRIYMTGESMGSIYTVSFANAYPDYLAAIAVMNGGPLDIEEGTPLEEAVQMDLSSPWSDAELKALADSQTSVMFIQGTGDIASIPIRYATVYTKLVNFGMTPDVDVVWNPYTAEQFNALLKGNTKIPVYATADVAVDPITGIETLTNGNFHNSSRVAGWDTRVRTWLMIQKLNKESLLAPDDTEDTEEAEKYVIGCIGDSITYGAGSADPETQSWPAQLQQLLGNAYDVRNFGKAGCSLTSKGVTYTERQEYQDALACQADAYIVMLGTNDSYEDTWDAEEYEEDLNLMIEDLREANPDTVITLMVPPHVFIDKEEKPHSQENSIIETGILPIMEKVSAEQGTILINLYEYTEDRTNLFSRDMLHPSTEGYVEIAAYVYAEILPYISDLEDAA